MYHLGITASSVFVRLHLPDVPAVCRPLFKQVTEVDEEKQRLMLSNKRVAADERVNSFKVGGGAEPVRYARGLRVWPSAPGSCATLE
jgi:hypothetical protein